MDVASRPRSTPEAVDFPQTAGLPVHIRARTHTHTKARMHARTHAHARGSLANLDLAFNQLTGAVPGRVLGSNRVLQFVDLNDNRLSGELPMALLRYGMGGEGNLQQLFLSGHYPPSAVLSLPVAGADVLEVRVLVVRWSVAKFLARGGNTGARRMSAATPSPLALRRSSKAGWQVGLLGRGHIRRGSI